MRLIQSWFCHRDIHRKWDSYVWGGVQKGVCAYDSVWLYGFVGKTFHINTRWGPLTTISGFMPGYTHLQPWLHRVCWGYNYLITRGALPCMVALALNHSVTLPLWIGSLVMCQRASSYDGGFKSKEAKFFFFEHRYSMAKWKQHAIKGYIASFHPKW